MLALSVRHTTQLYAGPVEKGLKNNVAYIIVRACIRGALRSTCERLRVCVENICQFLWWFDLYDVTTVIHQWKVTSFADGYTSTTVENKLVDFPESGSIDAFVLAEFETT